MVLHVKNYLDRNLLNVLAGAIAFICVLGPFEINAQRIPAFKQIVYYYDQPLKSEDIPNTADLKNKKNYSDKIDNSRFKPGTSVWIYIPDYISTKNNNRRILVTGYQDYMDLYAMRSGRWQKILTGGKYVLKSKLSQAAGREFVTLPEVTSDSKKGGYWVACRRYNNFNTTPLLASLMSPEEFQKWQSEFRMSAERYPKFILPFVGVLLTTVLHLFVLFFLSKIWLYTFHAIGILFVLTFFVLCYFQYPININDSFLEDPRTLVNFDEFVLFMAMACNFMLIKVFYNSGKWADSNTRLTVLLAKISMIVAISMLFLSFYTNLYYLINYTSMILEPIISGVYFIHLIKIRKEIKGVFRIHITGLLFLSFFLLLSFSLSFFASNNKWNVGSEVLLIFPMIVGISIYCGFIITAIVTRDYQTRLEVVNLKAQAMEAELASMQKGLSPHFIFNCLNLIDSFLYHDDSKSARKTLFDFGDLLRLVIDKSPDQLIRISEELKILELYMNLEKSRSANNFSYSISINPTHDLEQLFVPPLIVQPIVENAIKHGLLNNPGQRGVINITISRKSPSMMVIEVDDNGVGRQAARLFKSSSYDQTGHMGLALTRKRLEVISEIYDCKSYLEIFDKPKDGTIVRIILPVIASLRSR